MADTPLTIDDLQRHVVQHLESLRLAGVEWLPKGPPIELMSAPISTENPAIAEASTLFDEATSASGELSPEQRRTELAILEKRIRTCTRCPELASTRTQTVFSDGPVGAELCFIGEAPGGDEDAQGKPFVGAAGQLLNRILTACGLKREEVYICNIIKCRPPGNRTPKPEEASNCREYLTRQLELLRPKFICALGRCAAQNLLNSTLALAKLRGRFHDYKGIPVLCTYHPANLLPHRSPQNKKEVWEDMQLLMKRMGRTIPPRTS